MANALGIATFWKRKRPPLELATLLHPYPFPSPPHHEEEEEEEKVEYAQTDHPLDAKRVSRNSFHPSNIASWNSLIADFARAGRPEEARRVFNSMPWRTIVSWNALMSAYAHNGQPQTAFEMIDSMKSLAHLVPNKISFISILDGCDGPSTLGLGKVIHLSVTDAGFEEDVAVGTALVNMYCECGSVEHAKRAFDRMPYRNIVSWTSMVSAHARIGDMDSARSLFDGMPERNVVSWTSLISGYVKNGQPEEAFDLFFHMEQKGPKPNKVTFLTLLDACADSADFLKGKTIHASIACIDLKPDIVVGTALLDMYGRCGGVEEAERVFGKMGETRDVVAWTAMVTAFARNGRVKDARRVFERMPQRNVVSWTTMVAVYTRNGCPKEAFDLFRRMNLKPNAVTLVSMLDACAQVASLKQGKTIHAAILAKIGLESDVTIVDNALVNMYGKCGSIDDARSIFDRIPQSNVVSWSAMIAAYAQHGQGKLAHNLLERMESSGIKPNAITYVSILSACSHGGLLEEGQRSFTSMFKDHGIVPTVDHYACMIDLLGRMGRLEEADHVINKMPFEPPFEPLAIAWLCFLSACKSQGDAERGSRAAEYLFELNPKDATPYVLLSDIYMAAGWWDDVARVREGMKAVDVKRQRGRSCIEVKNKVHDFITGDVSHPQIEGIRVELQRLVGKMEEMGYVRGYHDGMEKEEKEHILHHHSEKMAIAFGLISSPDGTPIHVVKDLRICLECHKAIEFISKIAQRKIIVRDSTCIHCFEQGMCSCGGYCG